LRCSAGAAAAIPSQPKKQPAPASQKTSVITVTWRTNRVRENSFICAEFSEFVSDLSRQVNLACRQEFRVNSFSSWIIFAEGENDPRITRYARKEAQSLNSYFFLPLHARTSESPHNRVNYRKRIRNLDQHWGDRNGSG
jgi:hypothetical protein